PGQANIVLAAYRAAEADPHCEVPHEDMAELIDRTVRENAALRSELSALRADAERIAQYHTSDGYCTWCHRLDRDHWSDCPTAVARTALAAAGGGSGTRRNPTPATARSAAPTSARRSSRAQSCAWTARPTWSTRARRTWTRTGRSSSRTAGTRSGRH